MGFTMNVSNTDVPLAEGGRAGGAGVVVLHDSFLACCSLCVLQGGPWHVLGREMCPLPEPNVMKQHALG